MRRLFPALAIAGLLAAPPGAAPGAAAAERQPAVPAPPPGKKQAAERPAAEFEHRCTEVFGHVGWCRCVRERRPPAVDWDTFVLLTSRSRAELGYDELSDVEKDLVESTRAARDACVALLSWW